MTAPNKYLSKILSLLLIFTLIFTNISYSSPLKSTLRPQSQLNTEAGESRHLELQLEASKGHNVTPVNKGGIHQRLQAQKGLNILGKMGTFKFAKALILTVLAIVGLKADVPSGAISIPVDQIIRKQPQVPKGVTVLDIAQGIQKEGVTVLDSAQGIQKEGVPVLDIAQGIQKLADPKTGIPPSHWGHPEFEDLAFLYDAAVNALILDAAGYKKDAEVILDYFDKRLKISLSEIQKRADVNQIFGILKLFNAVDPSKVGQERVSALINAIDRTSLKSQGQGQLEWWTTPGPTAFMIFAMSKVNRIKYANSIKTLRKVLLAMQASDGGVRDGDRMPRQVHTEPHADALDAFLMTSAQADSVAALLMTSDALIDRTPWPEAAEAAWQWFKDHVLDVEKGVIDQGYGPGGRSTIFATDAYTWTMASPLGDRIQKEFGLDALKRLSLNLLHRGLVKITWTLPDGSQRTKLLFDFTDPTGSRVMRPEVNDPQHADFGVARGGYHPMGSTEWTGGAVLAFQKNAVRFWEAGDRETAIWFKVLADALEAETRGSFYNVDGVIVSEYATSHNRATGHGWRTPIAYVVTPKGEVVIQGGSTIGGWVALPASGINPFILNDNYKQIFDQIPTTPLSKARQVLEKELMNKPYTEKPLTKIAESTPSLVEPGAYNAKMWDAFNRGDYQEVIKWAQKLIAESEWVRLAKRDNDKKLEEVGGLIDYPWGRTFPNNENYLHDAVWRYPLLNEIAVAMWGSAAANFKLGNKEEAKGWIKRIIEEVPLHQIAAVRYNPDTKKMDLVQGYWNALISWEHNLGNKPLDAQMGILYREILGEMGLSSAAPKTVSISEKRVPRQEPTKQKTEVKKPTRTKPEPKVQDKQPEENKIAMSHIKKLTGANPGSVTMSQGYRAIIKMGEAAMPALIQNLQDPAANTDSRKWSALLIGEVGAGQYDKAKRVLESVIANEGGIYEWWHQAEAQKGLAILEENRKTKQSQGKIKDGAKSENLAESYIKKLTAANPGYTINSSAYRAIIKMGKAAVPALIKTLRDQSANTDARKWCARLIGEVGSYDVAYPVLQEVIKDQSGKYQSWHKAEAKEGLKILLQRRQKGKAHLKGAKTTEEFKFTSLGTLNKIVETGRQIGIIFTGI